MTVDVKMSMHTLIQFMCSQAYLLGVGEVFSILCLRDICMCGHSLCCTLWIIGEQWHFVLEKIQIECSEKFMTKLPEYPFCVLWNFMFCVDLQCRMLFLFERMFEI